MSKHQQWKHWQPGGHDPAIHNQQQHARKQFRRLMADTYRAHRRLIRQRAVLRPHVYVATKRRYFSA